MPKKKFRSFKKAREFVRSLGLKGYKEWREYIESRKKPEDIPADLYQTYKKDKGWKGMGDFLGSGSIHHKKEYRSFEEAREFVRSLNLKVTKEWVEYKKSGKKPDDIPATTNEVYKGWKGWGDFLGTGSIHHKDRTYRSFEEAREFAQSLNLKGTKEWVEYKKSGNKPDDIPATPSHVYKDKGWKGMGDFLGTENIYKKEYRSFEEAREFAQSLNLKSGNEWFGYARSKKRPNDIPINANKIYKDKGWKGMGDFLGSGNIASKSRVYRSFKEAREFAQSLNLNGKKEWFEYARSGKKPDDIPATPNEVYKDKGWKGWGDFLGTGSIHHKDRTYRSFKKARAFAQSLNLKGHKEWQEYCKSGKKPDDIPATPNQIYKGKGWKNWGGFLGTGNIANKGGTFRSFGEARRFIHSLNLKGVEEWKEYIKSGKKPKDIPSHPNRVYRIKK